MLWMMLSIGCSEKETDSGQTDAVTTVELNADAGPDQYVELGRPLAMSTNVDENIQTSWDFGDGTDATGVDVTHTFNDVGRYRVVLTITTENGQQSSDTMNVVVHHPLLEQSPQVSHRMAMHQNVLWTVYPEGNTLQGLVLNTDELYTIEICDTPSSIALHEDILRVTCTDSSEIATVDLSNGLDALSFSTLALGDNLRPTSIIPPSADDLWWFIDVANDQLGRIDTMDAITWFPVGGDLQGLARHPDGTLLLPHFRARSDGGTISTYNPSLNEWRDIYLPLDEAGDSDNTTGGTPNLLENVYPSRDGQTLWTPVTHANVLRGGFLNGESLSHETSLRGVLRTVDWETQEDSETHRKQFDEKGRASAVATSSYGDVVYVLHPGVASVSILDGFSRQILGSLSDLGIHPTDILQESDDLYVYSWLTREIIAFDIQDPIRPVQQWTRSFIESEVLSPLELKGKQIFHDASDTRMTKTGYIACAHCHPSGDHDGQTWDHTDRGEGLRNTTSLLSRSGVGMGRLHWSGNFDEVQDFEQDIRDVFEGSGFLSDVDWNSHSTTLEAPRSGLSEELDALAAYVTALPNTPNSPILFESNDVQHGEYVFYQVGCGECHPAPLYTDSSTVAPVRHDVGTLWEGSGQRLDEPLDGLDTPTLLNVRDTFPYLHDGSADTLEEAIRAHSEYAALNSEQIDALHLFLNSL